ncbi:hypothetical protein JS756_02315 [Streptomyces actuosus]|uniref:Uncharacterized protein n=1 Tax=Streptomyces actuosus TaxID=1885 RepID=A0ABS2VIP3_STRAS|nr:hypothetical protein [Streptomyces actuosus]MBN0042969.1 hypothetical protein [Streptomyces actuosus]
MTAVDALLARARLHRAPDVPADTVAYEDCAYLDLSADPVAAPPGEPPGDGTAAEQLDRLCEVVVTAVAPGTLEFLTDQLPEPPGAWLLGCALHLAGVDEGARFWWQYAAGAGHSPAAYCLSLHHHARGEAHAAAFWHDQTGLDQAVETDPLPVAGVCPSLGGFRFDASLPTVLRILSHLAAPGRRRLPHRADAVTNYVARAVAHGYLRYPGVEIPVPEPRFADRIGFLLGTDPPWARRIGRVFNPALPSRPPGGGASRAAASRDGAGGGRAAAVQADAAAASAVASWTRTA